jgi:hypothetical protein
MFALFAGRDVFAYFRSDRSGGSLFSVYCTSALSRWDFGFAGCSGLPAFRSQFCARRGNSDRGRRNLGEMLCLRRGGVVAAEFEGNVIWPRFGMGGTGRGSFWESGLKGRCRVEDVDAEVVDVD